MLKEWRLHLTWSYLAPPLLLGAQVWILCSDSNAAVQSKAHELLQTFGVFWPLALCLALASLIPDERQSGMLEMRLSYPKPYWRSLLMKTALPLVWWSTVGAAGLFACYRAYTPFPVWNLLQTVLPPTIAMGGFTLLSSALTLNMPATLVATVAWWGFELVTACRLSGVFALFPISMNVTTINLAANRWLLLALGVLLAALSATLLIRRRLPTVEE